MVNVFVCYCLGCGNNRTTLMITGVKTYTESHSNFQWVLIFVWQMCERMKFILHSPYWQRYKLLPKTLQIRHTLEQMDCYYWKRKIISQAQYIPSREVPATIAWTWFRHCKTISEFVNMYQFHDVKCWDSHSTHDFIMIWSICNDIWRLVWNVTQETLYVWSSAQK